MSDTNPSTGCRTSLTAGVDTTALERDVEVASALANETRYELLCLLAANGEVRACEFVGGVDASQGAVNRGLSTLYEAGLASRRKDGQWRYYAPPRRPSDCWRRSTRSGDENLREGTDSSDRMKDDQNGR